ncbi:MAG TPA: hypothetical protein VGI95_15005 [Caulobacteraceae bacterium]|jgi:hypothetical protein
MRFARWVFRIAGIYGLVVLIPGLFLEHLQGKLTPPPINHPEFYYGFYGAALVFQLMFLAVSTDPVKYRALMPIAVLEKLSFFIPCLALFLLHRMPAGGLLYGAMLDGVWMVLFAVAWLRMSAK